MDVGHLADRRVHVARHRDVEEDKRALPAGHRLLHLPRGDERLRGGCGGHHDVGSRKDFGKVPEGPSLTAPERGQVRRRFPSPAHHHDRARAAGVQGGGRLPGHPAGPYHCHAPAAELPGGTRGQLDRYRAHARGTPSDRRVGAHPLPGVGRGTEQIRQQRAAGPTPDRRVVGVGHLAQDLRLAQHQRIEARRDSAQVGRRRGSGVSHEVGLERGRIESEGFRQEPGQRLPGRPAVPGAAPRNDIELESVAGGENHELRHREPCRVPLGAGAPQRPLERRPGQGKSLPERDRRRMVSDAQTDDGHRARSLSPGSGTGKSGIPPAIQGSNS